MVLMVVVVLVAEVGEGRLGAARIPRAVRSERERELWTEARAGAGAGADRDCGCRMPKSMPASRRRARWVSVSGVGRYRRRCWASYGTGASKARPCGQGAYECGVGREGLGEGE